MQLYNTESDKNKVLELLELHKTVPAIFSLGVFESVQPIRFKTVQISGRITSIDLKSGYVEWIGIDGIRMPVVNINVIELKLT